MLDIWETQREKHPLKNHHVNNQDEVYANCLTTVYSLKVSQRDLPGPCSWLHVGIQLIWGIWKKSILIFNNGGPYFCYVALPSKRRSCQRVKAANINIYLYFTCSKSLSVCVCWNSTKEENIPRIPSKHDSCPIQRPHDHKSRIWHNIACLIAVMFFTASPLEASSPVYS